MSVEEQAAYLFRAKFFEAVCKGHVLKDGSTWFDNVEAKMATSEVGGGPMVALHYAVGGGMPVSTCESVRIFSFAHDVFTADLQRLKRLCREISPDLPLPSNIIGLVNVLEKDPVQVEKLKNPMDPLAILVAGTLDRMEDMHPKRIYHFSYRQKDYLGEMVSMDGGLFKMRVKVPTGEELKIFNWVDMLEIREVPLGADDEALV